MNTESVHDIGFSDKRIVALSHKAVLCGNEFRIFCKLDVISCVSNNQLEKAANMTNSIGVPPATISSSDEIQNARVGYQAAIHLIAYEGHLAWVAVTAFTPLFVLLLTGSVLERFPFVQSQLAITVVNIGSAVIGVLTSAAWLSGTARSRRLQKYWLASARELEQIMPPVCTLTRGKRLTQHQSVEAGGEVHMLSGYVSFSHTKCFFALYLFCGLLFLLLSIIQIFRLGTLQMR